MKRIIISNDCNISSRTLFRCDNKAGRWTPLGVILITMRNPFAGRFSLWLWRESDGIAFVWPPNWIPNIITSDGDLPTFCRRYPQGSCRNGSNTNIDNISALGVRLLVCLLIINFAKFHFGTIDVCLCVIIFT